MKIMCVTGIKACCLEIAELCAQAESPFIPYLPQENAVMRPFFGQLKSRAYKLPGFNWIKYSEQCI